MPRKQVYVDWETLKRLIQAKNQKKKAIVMPDQPWFEPEQNLEIPNAPPWADEELLEKLEQVFEQEITNSKEKMPSVVNEDDSSEATEAVRSALRITVDTSEKTLLFIVIIDKSELSANEARHVYSPEGVCFNGYVKDIPKDAYIVECVDYISLGTIPIAFKLSMPMTGGWTTPVPMPNKVVEKLLPTYYKRLVKTTRERYPAPRYELHYMQMLSCA